MPTRTPTATARTGLTDAEARRRLAVDGANRTGFRPRGAGAALISQVTDPIVIVLLVAAGLTAAVGDVTDTAVIVAVLVLNTAIGLAQELRSGRALAALAGLIAPRATVIRDGRSRVVDAAELVRGDLVEVTAGDVVAAEVSLADGVALEVDESAITGESIPVTRGAGDVLFAGSVVTRGHGRGEVVATGSGTELGGIARSLEQTRSGPTPVQRQLAVLGRRLAVAVAAIAALLAVVELATGHSPEQAAVLAISLAVAAIPESLPAVVSVGFALAARRMSDVGVLVRRLAAVEALGAVTVLATDKTGTLTEGRLTVSRVWTAEATDAATHRLLTAAALCTDARADDTGARTSADPLETALVDAARAEGIDVDRLRVDYPVVAEVPFDAETATMTTTHLGADAEPFSITKGAPEAVLAAVPESERAAATAEQLARDGSRVLALTRISSAGPEVLGLIAFTDPIRAGAAGMIAAFRRAGVRPVMVTGDHPATAAAVAGRVGIDPELDVFARVRPHQKSSLVARLQSGQQIVAMTGDGVNDAPALRAADVGVAVGSRATEVARQAADLVLTGDDLGALVPGIGEGRRAHDNLRRFLHYGLSGGLAEVFIMLGGIAVGFPVPLQAGQLLWVNLLTHGLPGVALGNEPAAPGVLERPPRRVGSQLIDGRAARRIGLLALVIAGSALAVGGWAAHLHRSGQSAIFVSLTVAQLGVALGLRPRGTRLLTNPLLLGAVLVNVALVLAAVGWSPLRELLHTRTLGPAELAACAVAALPAFLVARRQRAR